MSQLIAQLQSFGDALKPSWGHALVTLAGCVVILVLYLYPIREYTLPKSFRNIPGPKPVSFVWGNTRQILMEHPGLLHEEWFDTYGSTIRYRSLAGTPEFATIDPVAVGFILKNDLMFPKSEFFNTLLSRIIGNGILTVKGQTHRRHRRVLNPAFGLAQIKELCPIFWDKGYEMQRKLIGFFEDGNSEQPSPTPPKAEDKLPGSQKINVLKYIGQGTLDVIGLAGFEYEFESLSKPYNELSDAIHRASLAGRQYSPLPFLQNTFPVLLFIPTKIQRVVKEAFRASERICTEILLKKKAQLEDEHAGHLQKTTQIGRDILSLLMRANIAEGLHEHQRLNDEEVLRQATNLMIAGNETTQSALTWIMYRLAHNPEYQARVREELLAIDDDRPSLDVLQSLPLLDKVIRETLRMDGPIPTMPRYAAQDVVVPLGHPVRGRDGNMIESIEVKKGTNFYIPILNVNRSKEIWGEDAREWKPDRFDRPNYPTEHVGGPYGNLLSFLDGPRNCLGWRFAIAEMKVFLYVLLRTFTFDELPSKPQIKVYKTIVSRPVIMGEENLGPQLPLMVRMVKAE